MLINCLPFVLDTRLTLIWAGLIRWGIVIHGFIDGYSRLVTGLRASNNNRGSTVLELFLQAAHQYGVPSRLRGDHGVENILVAAWMEHYKGVRRGSYIWGRYDSLSLNLPMYLVIKSSCPQYRSVHNVRIERLWVDVTAMFGAKWSEFFTLLELHHGLNINNPNHIWLLHELFLHEVNRDADDFAIGWNHHVVQVTGGSHRTPADMFGFDMIALGVRGEALPEENLSEQELAEYGVDWQDLRDEHVLSSQLQNNDHNEGTTSWVGRVGPPPNLNEVAVHPPEGSMTVEQVYQLHHYLSPYQAEHPDPDVLAQWWRIGLAFAQACSPVFL